VGHVKLFGTDSTYDSSFTTNADSGVIEGMIGTSPAGDPSNPNYQKFANGFQAATGYPPPANAETGYDAVYILAYAATRGGGLTSAQIEPSIGPVTGGASPAGVAVVNPTAVGVGDYAKAVALLKASGEIAYAGAAGSTRIDKNGDPTVGTYVIWKVAAGQLTTVSTVTR
jgi:branched-chain amino acid transport system substrate-binding protein